MQLRSTVELDSESTLQGGKAGKGGLSGSSAINAGIDGVSRTQLILPPG
jgi:hypothetical protein